MVADRLTKYPLAVSPAWGAGRGASSSWTDASAEDEEKQSLFESMGFRNTGHGEPLDLGGRQVASVRLERR